MSSRHIVIPIFVPHKGCPHDCIFCNQKKISGQITDITPEDIGRIVSAYLATIEEGSHVEIGFYGGSFTGIAPETQRQLLSAALAYVREGVVHGIRLSTRPDYIDEETLKLLGEYGVGIIELGVQSLDEEVLQLSNRGHSPGDVYTACEKIKKSGFRLGIQTMIGLPGDTREKDRETAEKVIGLSPDIVRIYPALVIKGTFLETMFNSGAYEPLKLEEAVDICTELLELYESHKINVIRLGLQTTESIREGSEIAAGPFHPAFRQRVESRLALKMLESKIASMEPGGERGILILTGKGNLSNVIGQKRENLQLLKSKYGFTEIKVKENDTCSGREIAILRNY